MVEHADVEEAGSAQNALGQQLVVVADLGGTGGMIVDKDQPRGQQFKGA